MLSLLLASSLLGCKVASGTIISDAESLVRYSQSIYWSGTHLEETVYLDSDIVFTDELSEKFTPIGRDRTKPFKGTFRGLGHVIKGLTINTTEENVGLFGYAMDATIRDVIIDDSCKIVSTRESASNYDSINVGGIVGSIESQEKIFGIYNCVNMADIIHRNNGGFLYVGGIVGFISNYVSESFIWLSMNYGDITVTSKGDFTLIDMGGLIGAGGAMYQSQWTDVSHCRNFGDVTFSGNKQGTLNIDGLAGNGSRCDMFNCTNHGKVSE